MELSEVTMVKNVIKSLNVLIFVWAGENGNIKYIHSFNRIDDFLPLISSLRSSLTAVPFE